MPLACCNGCQSGGGTGGVMKSVSDHCVTPTTPACPMQDLNELFIQKKRFAPTNVQKNVLARIKFKMYSIC